MGHGVFRAYLSCSAAWLNQVVLPTAHSMTLASQTLNLPLNQLPASPFPWLWNGWIVRHMIPFFWSALGDLFGHVAGSIACKWLNCPCSPSCNESMASRALKATRVCSGMWWEQSACPDFHVCLLRDETRISVTKEAYFPLCRIGSVRTYSPRKLPQQATRTSQTKSFANTGMLQKVDLCSDAGLWTGAPAAGMAIVSAVTWEGV